MLLCYTGVTVIFQHKVTKNNLITLSLSLNQKKETMGKLENKVAVITGGNSGIGFGIAEAFKNEGAVGAIAGRNKNTLNSTVETLGGNFIGVKGDVTNLDDLENLFRTTADKFGKIDALVVNAGGVVDGIPLMSITDDGASIILIGSNAAHRAAPGATIYAAAKAAVISLARGLSLGGMASTFSVK